MRERPIIMNTEMVKAILEGRKTQTRRVIKPQPEQCPNCDNVGGYPAEDSFGELYQEQCQFCWEKENSVFRVKEKCPYGKVGDRKPLFEALKTRKNSEGKGGFKYKLPFALVEITDIRVERVQEISRDNALAEGIQYWHQDCDYIHGFSVLWDSIYGKDAWERNDWVWCISFKKV